MNPSPTDDPARSSFDALVDAMRETAELVRDDARGVVDPGARAGGYAYVTELVRTALDLYGDADGLAPRFVPFSTPTPYHAGELVPGRVQGGINPDGMYDFAVLRPDCSYRVSGRRGNDCYLSLSFSGGRDGEWPDRTAATFNDRQMTFAPDGSFEVVVSRDEQPGNWVRMEPDICSLIVRQYFAMEPEKREPATLHIEMLEVPDDAAPDDGQLITRRIAAAAAFVRSTNQGFPFPAGPEVNSFSEPLGYSGEAGALGTTDNTYCMGRWRLADGERLVIETTPARCGYWSLQMWNRWGQSMTSTIDAENYPRQIVNHESADLGADGSVRVVVAHADPGEPNWLDTFGWDEGILIFRFLYPEERPAAPSCRVEGPDR